jgi:hypothetical protein
MAKHEVVDRLRRAGLSTRASHRPLLGMKGRRNIMSALAGRFADLRPGRDLSPLIPWCRASATDAGR